MAWGQGVVHWELGAKHSKCREKLDRSGWAAHALVPWACLLLLPPLPLTLIRAEKSHSSMSGSPRTVT